MKFRFNYNGISQPRIFILIEFVSYSRQLLANAAVLIINNIKTNGMTTMTTTGNKLKMQLSEKKMEGEETYNTRKTDSISYIPR